MHIVTMRTVRCLVALALLLPLFSSAACCSEIRDFFRAMMVSEETHRVGAQRSAFLVHEGTLYFLQPDYTLTALDLDSGKVVKRDTSIRERVLGGIFRRRETVGEWTVRGNTAFGKISNGYLRINLLTGEMDHTLCDGNWRTIDALFFGSLWIHTTDHETLATFDTESWNTRVICDFRVGNFFVEDSKLFVLSTSTSSPRDHEKIRCFDIETGKKLWGIKEPKGAWWTGMFLHNSDLYVLDQPRENGKWKLEEILVFDASGKKKESIVPNEADFGGSFPSPFSPFTFRDVEYSKGRRKTEDSPDFMELRARKGQEDKRAEAILGRKATGPYIAVGKDGILGLEYTGRPPSSGRPLAERKPPSLRNAEEGKGKYRVFMKEGLKSWQGRVNSLEKSSPEDYWLMKQSNLFHFAVTDQYVILGMPNGRVECLERRSGRSRWQYSYPYFDYQNWQSTRLLRFSLTNRTKYGSSFYTQVRSRYEANLSPGTGDLIAIDGDGAPQSARLVIDPDPIPFPSAGPMPFFAWGAPAILLLFLLLSPRPASKEAISSGMWRAGAVMIFGLFALCLTGRYTLPSAAFAAAVVVAAIARYLYCLQKAKKFS